MSDPKKPVSSLLSAAERAKMMIDAERSVKRSATALPMAERDANLKRMFSSGMAAAPEVENAAKYKELQAAMDNLKGDDKTSIIPMPNRWFLQPDKHPQQQAMVERVLAQTGLPRESFTSGAFIDPRTGQVLDGKIFEDVGVAINPQTNRPSMTAGKEAGIELLDPSMGPMTRSNLVRNSLFGRTGGDPMLDDLGFLATIERSGMGHQYGLSTEYGSPTLMYNTGRSGNPTLRPTSRGDVFGMGDVVGQVKLSRGEPHDVYEKLFVAPAGMDVPGVKLHKAAGGAVHMAGGGQVQRFDEGGQAQKDQPSLDQMRFELSRKAPKRDEVEEFNQFEAAGAPTYAKPLDMEGRATFLPFKDSMPGSVMNKRELAVPGILAEAFNAITAPARSVTQLGFDAPSEAQNLGMNVMGGGMGLSRVAPAPKGSLGMFVGDKAVGADLVARDTAKARLAAGEDPALVWRETGWAAPPWAPDQMRYEISDNKMASSAGTKIQQKNAAHSQKVADLFYATEAKKEMEFNARLGLPFVLDDFIAKIKTASPFTPAARAMIDDPTLTYSKLKAAWKPLYDKDALQTTGKLGKSVQHDDLYKAYPNFATDLQFRTLSKNDVQKGIGGAFDPYKKELLSDPNLFLSGNPLPVLAHELQHGVQFRQGWSPGASSTGIRQYPYMYDPVTAAARDTMLATIKADTGRIGQLYAKQASGASLTGAEASTMSSLIKSLPEYIAFDQASNAFLRQDTPFRLYERTAGEAEARLTGGRQHYTPEVRRQKYPYDPVHFYDMTGISISDVIPNVVHTNHNMHSQAGKPTKKADGGLLTDTQDPAIEALKNTVKDPQVAKMFDLDLANFALMNQPRRMANGGIARMDEGGRPPLRSLDENISIEQLKREIEALGRQRSAPTTDAAEVANNARLIADRQTPVTIESAPPDMGRMFDLNSKPATLAYAGYDPSVPTAAGQKAPRTIQDDRMDELRAQLDRGIKPDWMPFHEFAQSQVERGRGGGHTANALMTLLDLPNKLTGSSMGIDPMMGLVGKMGELHSVPKAGRYVANRAAPYATKVDDMVRELYESGVMPQPGLSIKSVGDQSGKAPKRLPKAAPATTASVPPVRTLEEQAVIDKFGQKHSQEAARLKKVEKALAAEAKQAENVANGTETAAPAPKQVKTKTPNFGAVPADFYRTMADTQGDDAVIKAAEAGKHLRKTPDGGFVGAPRTITSSQGLGGMRRGMDTDFVDSVDAVYLADPSRLGTWYDRAKQGIAMSTEPYQLNRVLGQHSVYSAGVSPESELAFALKHLNSRVAGTPTMAYRGAGMDKLDDADFMYRRPKLGFKIGEYGQKNDPRVPNNGLFGVNDFRRAQGMGYTDPQGKPWKAGVSTAMHPFMDAETALQVARANVAKVGGRGDWAGPHIQEVPWVYGKAQDFHKRGVKSRYAGDELEGIKQSLIDANNTARDYMYKHTLSATHEEVPGAALNHVPQVHAMTPAERAQYSSIGRWDRPTPEAGTMFDYNNIGYKEIPLQGPNMRGLHAYKATKGAPLPQGGATVPTDANRDALYSALGYRQLPSIPSQGLYTNQLGGLETNPMTIARPLMDFPTGGGGGRIADSSSQTAAATEQFRSLVGAQEAGGFNLGNTSKGVKGKNALVLDTRHLNPSALQDPTTGVQPSASQLTQIEQLLSKYKDKRGDPIIGVTATNRGISIFPFDPDTKAGDWNKIFNKNLKAQIEAIYPSKQMKAKMTTGYVPGVGTRHPKYGYPVASKPFSGAATIDMLEHFASLPPKVAQNLSESETVRNIIREKTKRDDKMGGARGDIQTTREFFSDANWNKVVELIRQGMAPTAALASVGYSASSMAGENK